MNAFDNLQQSSLPQDVLSVTNPGVEKAVMDFFARCSKLPPMLTGIVYPCSVDSILGALEAERSGLLKPVFYGPATDIGNIASTAKINISNVRIVNTASAKEAAVLAAQDAGNGLIGALMKGSLHSDEYLHAIMSHESQLLTGRMLSHCALAFVPNFNRPIILTDAALNIAPSTAQKVQICQNAINFARALGIENPKVAVLAAIESVNLQMPATIDGAILAKMAERGQIIGGLVDGPIDLDGAISIDAARTKGILSPVAGVSDILLAPDIESGNLIYKELSFMGQACTAGLVVGAKVPVILTSRADSPLSRRLSAAVALIYAQAINSDPSILTSLVGRL